MSSRAEQIRKLSGLRTRDARLKLIWMWIKQEQLTLKDFQSLMNEIDLWR